MKSLRESLFDKDLISKDTFNTHPKSWDELHQTVYEYLKAVKPKEGETVDLNWINTKDIDDMGHIFYNPESDVRYDLYNYDVSKWNVKKVKCMYELFCACKYFNCDISGWDVSNLEDAEAMFYCCENFNQNLSKWNVRKLKYMYGMFEGCNSLKKIPNWYKVRWLI